jgi:hypothetical protein
VVEAVVTTETVQLPPAERLPPLNVILPELEDTVPPHCGVVGIEKRVRFAGDVGNVSVNPTPDNAVPAFGFVIVKVSVLLAPA